MSDDPYYFMKFDVAKWERDLDIHPLEIKGAWITICCKLWWASKRGELTLLPERWGAILRQDTANAERILEYLLNEKICDGRKEYSGYYTIISRKMVRDEKKRTGNRNRQTAFREKGGGHPEKWNAIRVRILELDEYMCAYCGRRANTVDHVIPRILGGNEDENNLVACCKRCNMQKTNRTPKEANMQFWGGFKRKTSIEQNNNTNITPSVTPQNKNNIKNKSKKKNKESVFVLPEWIEKDSWNGFVEFRKKKGPFTDRAKTMMINKLDKLRQEGNDPSKVLDQSVFKGWTDVYALKPEEINQTIPEFKTPFVNCPRCKKEIAQEDLDGEGCVFCAKTQGVVGDLVKGIGRSIT